MEKESNREVLEKSYAEMNRLRIEEKKNQLNTEFQRYKQDCRKRALDLAADMMRNKPVTENEQMLKIADKYYNWLISIPEKQ